MEKHFKHFLNSNLWLERFQEHTVSLKQTQNAILKSKKKKKSEEKKVFLLESNLIKFIGEKIK